MDNKFSFCYGIRTQTLTLAPPDVTNLLILANLTSTIKAS